MKLKKIIFESIQIRIVLLLLVSIIPPSLLGVVLLDLYAEHRLIKLAEAELKQDAEQVSHFLITSERDRNEDLHYLAAQPAIQSLNKLAIKDFLQNFTAFHKWEGIFMVFDIHGKTIYRTDDEIVTNYKPSGKWLDRIKKGENQINELVISPIYHNSMDCSIVPLQKSSNQQKVGMVASCLPLLKISQSIRKFSVLKQQERTVLINPQGWIYADTDYLYSHHIDHKKTSPLTRKVLSGEEGFQYFDDRFVYLLPMKFRVEQKKTWGLVLESPKYFFLQAVSDVEKTGYFLVLSISLIIGFTSWKVVEYTTKPILELTKAAKEIANENLDYVIKITQQDEIGTLATSFTYMTQRLKSLIDREVHDAIYRVELEKGRQIQQDFLPGFLPKISGWEIATVFEPARSVSGDFYDVFTFRDGHVGVVIGDVCDKGVGAAMFMGLFRSLLRVFSGAAEEISITIDNDSDYQDNKLPKNNSKACEFLKAVYLTNNYIATEHCNMTMFATLFFGILDSQTGELTYINGGHEPVFILNAQGIKHQLKATGPAVGMIAKSQFTIKQVQMYPGDLLVGYTDGVTDARSPEREFFSRKRLEKLLVENYQKSSEILDVVKEELMNHILDSVQFDDITMLAISRSQ